MKLLDLDFDSSQLIKTLRADNDLDLEKFKEEEEEDNTLTQALQPSQDQTSSTSCLAAGAGNPIFLTNGAHKIKVIHPLWARMYLFVKFCCDLFFWLPRIFKLTFA
jgi:hypothetical protein